MLKATKNLFSSAAAATSKSFVAGAGGAVPAKNLAGGVTLNSRDEIESMLSQPTWCVSELFERVENDSATERPTYETLSKLLKQAGLNSVEKDSPRANKLLQELDTQLTFVSHISEVDTKGIEPLVRISGEPIKARMEDLFAISEETAPETVEPNNWQPVALSAERSGNFYVLHEGLAKEA
ncbi:Uncharacterized protein AWJ20_4172 [Sugiyamaella lignohabitans]|uniref:Glu-AdT subunit F n=1 Tax=Sugiyamaella lignohabitans TaxID=796027 RepID=A0A167C8T3_9ASCO|nr:Uncharacterized protein AWJ20_4172 [Sugiyamaella lignohabitans]ANB11366.1 Uncharacterized protein AWJ20_4172 [Sugiyamaella lignohabitans]